MLDHIKRIRAHFADSAKLKQEAADTLAPAIARAGSLMTECLFADGKILACGNGGSASDAQHFSGELVGRFERERPELPAISLSEPFVKPTTMLYRNFLAMETEELLRSHPIDAAVLMGGCDKTTPGLLMGAISMNLPATNPPLTLTGGELGTPCSSPPGRGWGWVQGRNVRTKFGEFSP